MEIRSDQFALSGGSGLRVDPRRDKFKFIPFNRPVERMTVALSAMSSRFVDEHSFGAVWYKTVPMFTGRQAFVHFLYGLRDFSGDYDDAYVGAIQAVAIAEPMDEASIQWCSNVLTINQIMIRQGVGHYRNWQVFNPLTPLQVNRATAVRVSVGFKPDAATPRLTHIAGEMRIDGQGFSLEQQKRMNMIPLNRNGEGTMSFFLTPEECQFNLSVRFQAWGSLNLTPLKNSYYTGTIFTFSV